MKHRRPALPRWSPTAEQLRRLRDAGDDRALVFADKAMYKGRKVLKRYLKRAAGSVPNAVKSIRDWTVHNLDVWGNEDDGYEINQVYGALGRIHIPNGSRRKQIVSILKREGYLKSNVTAEQIEVDINDDTIQVDEAATGEPIYLLNHVEGIPQFISRRALQQHLRRSRKHRGGA